MVTTATTYNIYLVLIYRICRTVSPCRMTFWLSTDTNNLQQQKTKCFPSDNHYTVSIDKSICWPEDCSFHWRSIQDFCMGSGCMISMQINVVVARARYLIPNQNSILDLSFLRITAMIYRPMSYFLQFCMCSPTSKSPVYNNTKTTNHCIISSLGCSHNGQQWKWIHYTVPKAVSKQIITEQRFF